MQTTATMLEEHINLIKRLRVATKNQQDYIDFLRTSNRTLHERIDALDKNFAALIKVLPQTPDP